MYSKFLTRLLKRTVLTALGLLLGISLYGLPVQAAIQGAWSTQASSYRGQNGQRITFTFPGGGTTSGRLWGTGTYTDDSSIALAAVHAGLISPQRGGTVTIEIIPGQKSYQGSTRNGVTSNGYGSWHGSFRFVDSRQSRQDDYSQSRREDSRHSRQDDYRRSREDDSRRSRQTVRDSSTVQGAWSTQASSYRGRNGQRITFTFPGGGTTSGRLWGTGTYTDDSSIALAAVHAGLISPQRGGTVTIEIIPGQKSYQGSTRNGVTSNGYGSWHGSFRFVDSRQSRQDDYSQSRREDSRHSRQDDYRRSREDDSRRSRQTVRDSSTVQGAWSTQASSYRGRNGQRITFTFPGGGTTSGRLWGTGTYTDDSSIALAAVHAGLISPQRGGTVTIEIIPGQKSYQGSTRNGVTSNGYGSWHGSFRFVDSRQSRQDDYSQSRREDSRHSRQDDYRRSREDDSRRSRQTVRDSSTVQGAWSTQASSYRGRNGQRITFTFPGGGTTSGRLWGTGTYTDDSSIALAAVHAGLISPQRGGTVTIEIIPGQKSYQGSTRNGVTSNGYGSWHGSFRFVNP